MSAQPALQHGFHTNRAQAALRLGFLGLGWIGRMRLDALAASPDISIAAVADSDSGKLNAAASAYPDAQATHSPDALLDCDLDGVVIATPNGAHAQQAIACLSRGLPVFCQKPLATTASEAERVIEAARTANRLLGIDFCYRHVNAMDELRRRIQANELGEILSIDLTFHNAYGPDKPWVYDRALSGGGCLLDLGVHLIDLALWLQNAPLRLISSRLFAKGGRACIGAGAIEDMVFAEFEQPNGAIVRIACSWNAHAGRDAVIGMEVLGADGGAAWRNVEGSFFDFTLDVFRGRSSERIAAPPDAWGPRALHAWAQRLRQDRSFDPAAALIGQGAQLIDEIYRA